MAKPSLLQAFRKFKRPCTDLIESTFLDDKYNKKSAFPGQTDFSPAFGKFPKNQQLSQSSSLPKCFPTSSFRLENENPHLMSKHNSLKRKGGATGKRSVMKRFERVKLMKERGDWKDGQSAIGLPKTKAQG